ncbi:shikimate kinase [Thermodesulfobacteriota bacterium]
MRIFLTGVGCVGKTTIGKIMGELLGVRFFDLDNEIESFFETSIERLQDRFLTIHSFHNEAAKALMHLLSRQESQDCVIALPPSGLMGGYLRAIKKANGITVAVTDKPENILERIRFYDRDSRPIEKKLTPKEKKLYLKEIQKDITYFRTSYQRANLRVDISGLDQDQAAGKVKEAVEDLVGKVRQQAKSEHKGCSEPSSPCSRVVTATPSGLEGL